MKRLLVLVALVASGCTQSVYDFPVPTLVGDQRGYSMTGYIATADETVARQRVIDRFRGACPNGANIVDFKSERADAIIGTKILRYEALATCVKS